MGGGGADLILGEVAALYLTGIPLILVHGGGPEIDRWLATAGIKSERVDGLRVTDAATLEVTEAVLCATVNKRIVRELIRCGARAAGVSGEDGGLLSAQIVRGSHDENLGFVGGDILCNPELVNDLLFAGYLPVVAPLALAADAGHALNVNADLAAAAIAAATHARAFIQITNVPRVFADPRDPSTAIDAMSSQEARMFARSAACSGGMRPKIDAAVLALEGGAERAWICAAGPAAIARALQGDATTIY